VRVKKLLTGVLGLCRLTVFIDAELDDRDARPALLVWVRAKVRRRGRCGRCGELAGWYDQGGGERRWRHVDVAYATCTLIGLAP